MPVVGSPRHSNPNNSFGDGSDRQTERSSGQNRVWEEERWPQDKLQPLASHQQQQDKPFLSSSSSSSIAAETEKKQQAGLDIMTAEKENESDAVYYSGFLRKRYSSSMYMGTWRYCILQGNRLRWYMTQELARNDVHLRGEVWVKDVESWDGNGSVNVYANAFAIRTTTNRLLLCSAKTVEEKDEWLTHLQRCVRDKRYDGSIERHHGHDNNERRRIVPEDMMRGPRAASEPAINPSILDDSLNPRSPTDAVLSSAMSESMVPSPESCCAQCSVRFKTIMVRKYVCGSCSKAFCFKHCSLYVKLHQLHGSSHSSRRCCNLCARRQEFIQYLQSVCRFMNAILTTAQTMEAVVQKMRPVVNTDAEKELLKRTVAKLRYGRMSLIKTIKILYQTRKKPHLFRITCERLPFYTENCIDRVENLWYQILHLFQCCDAELESSSVQLYYLKRYIRAICRRSPRIALQTIWHVQASVGDSSRLHPHSLLTLLGFLYPLRSDNTKIWRELLLADCPEHQATEILADLTSLYTQSEQISDGEPDSLLKRWLNASSVPEFEACAYDLASSGTDLCDFQSSILYDALDVGDSDDGPVQIESLVFDQVKFVQSLTAISERLRYVRPIQDRGKHLEAELKQLNDQLHASALYPLCQASDELYRVVRIPPNEGKVFSTKMRAPTLIFVETVPVDAAYLVGLDDRFRPFVSSSHPRNSTFFESLPATFCVPEETTRESNGNSSTESSADAGNDTKHRRGSHMSFPDSESTNYEEEDSFSNTAPPSKPVASVTGRHMTFPVLSNPLRGDPHNLGKSTFSRSSSHHPHNHQQRDVDKLVHGSKVFGQSWVEKQERIRRESPMGHLPGWKLFSVIVKTNDDLRQEMFTMQMINKFKSIFEYEETNLWLRTYRIVATGANTGLLETINDACSLDHLKKNFPGGNLYQYFQSEYGDPASSSFESARRRFIASMAAYSIVSYILLVKDRHNGNILLSSEGHIIHIDFGFILGIAPGGMFSLEDAPFKLTVEMVDVMGGIDSRGFKMYRKGMRDALLALQKYHSEIVALLQTTGQHSPFPCLEGAKLARVVADLRNRLCVGLTKKEVEARVDQLIRKSYDVWGTRQYDAFQLRSNNIHP